MLARIVAARCERGHLVWLRFSDGLEGEVDLSGDLDGPMFEPLRDPAMFGRVRLDPTLHTLVWPNGADLAPEFLRARLLATA
jgi:hypothetical protein